MNNGTRKNALLNASNKSNELNQFIKHIIYINLDTRVDRKDRVEKELSIFNKNKVHRMPAIQMPDNPILGCALSHLNALKYARDKKWNQVLILEDDAIWKDVINGVPLLEKLLKNNFDVIMLGGTYATYNKETYRVNWAQSAHAYLVKRAYYDKIIKTIEDITSKDGTDKNVDIIYTGLQKVDNWYIIKPALMIQDKGKSNIQKANVNYRNLF